MVRHLCNDDRDERNPYENCSRAHQPRHCPPATNARPENRPFFLYVNFRLTNGRPRLGTAKRDRYVKISFNDGEYDRVDILSAKAGMNKAEYVRIRALEDVIIAFLADEEKSLIHELKKLGPNLNQIAHTGNTEGLTAIENRANLCLDMVADILINLKKRTQR